MLHALGGILLRAVPTFLLVVLLHFYLKSVFFSRLRRCCTRGTKPPKARANWPNSLEQAAAKTAKYEAALQAAKAELYRTNETLHKEQLEREAEALSAARQRAEASVRQARELLAADVEAAKKSLAADSDALATQIADSILRRSAA